MCTETERDSDGRVREQHGVSQGIDSHTSGSLLSLRWVGQASMLDSQPGFHCHSLGLNSLLFGKPQCFNLSS